LRGIILKDDRRYDYTEAYLKERGFIFDKNDTANDIDFAIFPFMDGIDREVYNDAYFASLSSSTIVFSGVWSEYLACACEKYGMPYFAMANTESVKTKNATPTSEGVIAYLINNRIDTIAGSRILVIGYGVCGSDLARRLKSLGAKLYALVRSEEKEAATRKDLVTPIYLDEFPRMPGFDIIINTVPNRVLTDDMLSSINDTTIIDISSKPHGFDVDKATILPGLPGKYAIRSSGHILGEFIEGILRGKKYVTGR